MTTRILKGVNGNKNILLHHFGVTNVKQLKSRGFEGKAKEIYPQLLEQYNEDVREHNKEIKRQQAKKKRDDAKIKQYVIELKDNIKDNLYQIVNDAVKNKKSFKLTIIDSSKDVLKEKEYHFENKTLHQAWTEVHHDCLVQSPESYIWNEIDCKVFITNSIKKIPTQKIIQTFFEGNINCVLKPIIEFFENKYDETENKKTKQNVKTFLNKANELEQKYHEIGVNQDALQDITNKLQIDIHIELPFQKGYMTSKSNKKPYRTFHYVNTKLNHVDFNELTHTDNEIIVTLVQLKQKQNELDKNKEFYTYQKNYSHIKSIDTLNTRYVLDDKYKKTVYDFEIETGINEIKLDDITQNEVSQFVRQGCHFNETIDVNKPNEYNMFHIDMKKAYINYKSCKYYDGFIGKITDFRKCNKIMGIGYYQIKNIVLHGKLKKMNEYLNCYADNVYPSVELKMMLDYGCSFDIICGCWGSEFDFEFNDEMINGKEFIGKDSLGNDISNRYYCKYVGQMFCVNHDKSYYMKTTTEFQQHLVNELDADINIYDNEVKVSYPKQHKYHLSHVCGFILSYMRMNMIEQLEQFNREDIIKIVVDGIYHTRPEIKLCNVFRYEEKALVHNIGGSHYFSNYLCDEFNCGEFREHNMIEVHIGAGGCGKTHNQLIDKGFVSVCYYAPSWKLARNKQAEYKCNVDTIAKLTSLDPSITGKQKKYYNVMIIDEVSMMSNEEKEFIIETFCDCKLIFCGDIGYQLPCFQEKDKIKSPFNMKGMKIIQYETNYRVKCEKLATILKDVREMIDHDINPRSYVLQQCKKGNTNEYDYKNDLILCSTHINKDIYTEKYKHLEKYYILQSDRIYGRGEIYFEKPETNHHEIRHAFTVHSIQGETAKGKIFIDMNNVYNTQMIYTAISRAKYLDQIVLII